MQKKHRMRIKIGILFIGILGVISTSCDLKKTAKLSESEYYTDSIYSKHLKEYRRHNVYLPRGFDSGKEYPIIYATDGNQISEKKFYKRLLDSLIDNQIIKPTILIESHNNSIVADSSGTVGNGDKLYLNYRNFEYVENQYIDSQHNPKLSDRFKNHLNYFNDELIFSVENKLNQKLTKDDRYFYGVSNGGGFGMSMLNKKPNTIGTYLCFSIFGGNIKSNIWKLNVDYPNLYSEYGSEEPFFLKEDAEFLKTKFNELNLFAEINEFDGGHDYKIWNEKFIEIISKELAIE
jgi:enterochelin esterase-like enzyme